MTESYITIPAKTGLNTQSVHVDGSLLINSKAPIMFNSPAQYVVPSTAGQLDAIRIGVSGQPNGSIAELLAEPTFLPYMTASSSIGDEKFRFHKATIFNSNAQVRSSTKIHGKIHIQKGMDLSLSKRQRKITLKAEQTKAVTISTSSGDPELLLLDTKTIQSDKNILKYQGSVLVNGGVRVTTGLQVVSRTIVYPNETGNITFPRSTYGKFGVVRVSTSERSRGVEGTLSAFLMPPIAAGSSIRIVNEPTSFVTYRIRSRNTSNLPPVIINNMDNTQAWKIHDDIRSIICSSISTLKWLCTTETMHGDPTNEHTALQGYTSGTVRNAEIHGKVEFTGQIVHLDDQKMMRQHFASSQYGFQLKGGAIKVLGSSLSHGTALNVGVSNLTSGTALRILHTNPSESSPIQCLVLNTTSKYATP